MSDAETIEYQIEEGEDTLTPPSPPLFPSPTPSEGRNQLQNYQKTPPL